MRGFATEPISAFRDDDRYFTHVFAWMGFGLLVTAVISAAIGHSQHALHVFLTSGGFWVVIGLLVAELFLVGGLVSLVQHLAVVEAAAMFIGYAALNGVTLSVVFAAYTSRSIYATFFVTAAMFAVLAIAGYTTGIDLTRWGSFLFMALVGQLIGLVVNLVWFDDWLYWLTTVVGVLLFSAYTAYDVQKLKHYDPGPADEGTVEKSAIVGALALYLDFVNLFLYLLRILGRRR